MDKKIIRRQVKKAVLALPDEQLAAQATRVVERLTKIIDQRQPNVVALFAPLPDEINIFPLVDNLHCRVVLPRIINTGEDEALMEFFDYSPQSIARGAFGINEPQGERPIKAEEIDIMIVPGVAFTPSGQRLGRGRGYYDRYLSREGFRALKIGVCHGCQLLAELPTQPYDIEMDIIISAE